MFAREHLARKTDLVSNVTDVFNRQQVSSDPGVRQYDKLVSEGDLIIGKLLTEQFQPHCSRCDSSQHFTVSCPLKTATTVRQDDAMVDSFILGSDEEEPEYQKNFVDKVRKSWNL